MFGMSQDLKSLKDKSVHQFKRIVIAKMKENSLNYLLSVKEKHSKMDDLTNSAEVFEVSVNEAKICIDTE
jgi:hypothetical protein